MEPSLIVFGFLMGMISGSTGIGAGTLVTPFLIFVLKVDPLLSVGTDLFVSALTKITGSFVHKRANNIDMLVGRPLVTGGIAGALLGIGLVVLLKWHVDMHSGQTILRRTIGITLCTCAAAIALNANILAARTTTFNAVHLPRAVGFVVAAITLVTGMGVGALTVPVLYVMKGASSMPTLVGTSIFYAAIITSMAAIAHIALHDVNYFMAALILAGSLPGVVVGSTVSTRMASAAKPAIALLMCLTAAPLVR